MRIVRKIIKLILILTMLYAIYFIWKNQDEIVSLGYNLFKSERKVTIKEANEYKRYYSYKTYSSVEEYDPHNKKDLENIIFNYLNNGWDEFTFYCEKEYENCFEDIKELSKNKALLSSINNYVNPFNSFHKIYMKVNSNGSITLYKEYVYNEEMIETVNATIDAIMENLKLDEYDTKTKIKKIHDYIIKRFEYDKNYVEDSPVQSANAYGALTSGKAICSGYADTMAIFLDKLKIPNFKVASEKHVWNLVYIDDKWYHLDATWDDPINSVTNENIHTYFLIDTKKLLELDTEQHTFDENLYTELKEA